MFVVTTLPRQAIADPAINAVNFRPASSGTISTTVPDGICAVAAIVTGGGGGASGVSGKTGGSGGAGASINAKFQVLPSQAVTGAVGAGGKGSNTTNGNTPSIGGSGTASGGDGGLFGPSSAHRGGGGGGSSSISVAGSKLIEAGGGGGGGAAHQNDPVGFGGDAGFANIDIAPPASTPPPTGKVAVGLDGNNGFDNNNTTTSAFTVGGGKGGQAAAGGAGGSNTGLSSATGSPGGDIGSGTGGKGGPDPNFDTAGGGGGGYTGGGGGASTVNSNSSGGGGGGGSSYISVTSPIALTPAPTNISGAAGTRSTVTANGATGAVTLDWIPCVYSLGITKKASAAAVKAGDKVIWTVTVTNSGPDPMTRGDTITLADTLPTTGIGSPAPQFKVLSLTTTGSATTPTLDSAPITCTGVTVGQAMPASTVCSRPYSSASSPGVTTGGTRGLNSGETLTITYEEIFANKTAAATITNTASTTDRSSVTGATDIIGVTAPRSASDSVTIQPYDLQVVKSVSSTTIAPGATLTWTVNVTNLGLADMEGPTETAANPLIVTDVAPTTNVSAPINFTSTGSAGTCTYALGTITCPQGLLAGQTQTFTFQQTVNANAATNATISNTATVIDYVTGNSNNSSAASTMTTSPTLAKANVLLVKRITAINGSTTTVGGDNLSIYKDEPANPYDDNIITIPNFPSSATDPQRDTDKWPSIGTFLIGGTNGGKIKPNDQMDYTIYFLSAGDGESKAVTICDLIPANQTFVPTAFNTITQASGGLQTADRGILIGDQNTSLSYTNIVDGDNSRYYQPLETLPDACKIKSTDLLPPPNPNGAIVVNLGTLPVATSPTPTPGSYGFVRFRVKMR